jgi:IS5 family transposase
VIDLIRAQLNFGDRLIADEIEGLDDDWMRHVDEVPGDEQILTAVVLRLLILKHVRNWNYDVLEREVRANLVYRNFTRVGFGRYPDAKTMGRWRRALGPKLSNRFTSELCTSYKRKASSRDAKCALIPRRWSITHHPTVGSLLGDVVRVLTRVMKKISDIAGEAGAKLRGRSRSVKKRVQEIARAARAKGAQSQENYAVLLNSTRR